MFLLGITGITTYALPLLIIVKNIYIPTSWYSLHHLYENIQVPNQDFSDKTQIYFSFIVTEVSAVYFSNTNGL